MHKRQAEGEEIFKRTPYVDIVVGPQSYHTLPDLIGKLARAEKHLIELADLSEEEKFDNLPETYESKAPVLLFPYKKVAISFVLFVLCLIPEVLSFQDQWSKYLENR